MPRRKTQNTKLLQVRVTPQQYEAIDKLAMLKNTTVAEVLRQQIDGLIARAQNVTGSNQAA